MFFSFHKIGNIVADCDGIRHVWLLAREWVIHFYVNVCCCLLITIDLVLECEPQREWLRGQNALLYSNERLNVGKCFYATKWGIIE